MSIPQSTICVCENVRLNSRYEHTIYFADRAAQHNYFAGKVVKTFPAYSFIRKTWDLNVAATMEDAASWTYLYFTNSANGKRYYYFIDNIEYVNDGTVKLKLQIDVLQTYLFDFDLLECFVERNHTTTDSAVSYTVDEGLETGELIDNDVVHWTSLNNLCILVLSTINPNYTETEEPVPALAGAYNNVFSGLKVWAVEFSDWAAWGAKLEDLQTKYGDDGIVAMWMYPRNMVDLGGENAWGDGVLCKVVDGALDGGAFMPYNSPPTTVDGYTPKNKKLLTYPYSFLYVSNNCGASAVYRWERFTPYAQPQFTTVGSLSPEGAVKMIPRGYNGQSTDRNYEHGLSIGGFPTCAWNSDIYKMWLAQNQHQLNVAGATAGASVVGGAIAAVAGLATGNIAVAGAGATAAIGGAQKIASLLAQKADMAIQPPQAKGSYSSNVNITAGRHTFSFYNKSVTAENAKIIDDYFTMYGYKINRVQKPNIHARKSHTYVKTIGCHIDANLCNEDATKIEAIFDNGVTFWSDGDAIGRYSADNSPL